MNLGENFKIGNLMVKTDAREQRSISYNKDKKNKHDEQIIHASKQRR